MMQKDTLQAGIWLIGLGILAITNFWWPGIMFLMGVAILASGSIQWALWPLGIGVLALLDFWWPGILFLMGISVIVNALLPDSEQTSPPDEYEATTPEEATRFDYSDEAPARSETKPPTAPTSASRPRLPSRCPACGAPITADEAVWQDATHADCPYCHTPLSPI